jgi:hypothetical protein
MWVVPSSPRLRRRLLRLGIALAAVGAVAAIVVLVRSPKGPNPAPAKNAPPAQLVTQSTHVSPADRRAINATLDRFIPAALDRSSPQTAWRLAGPELKGGSTLQQWRRGTSPLPYYPARGKTFHSWTTIDAGPGYVDFSLLVHPKHGAPESSWVFAGAMVKRGGRWLVNGLYTTATMARPTKTGRHEVGPADFAAGAPGQNGQSTPPPTGKGALGKAWLLAAAGAVVLALLFPLAFGVASVIRSRQARRRYARSDPRPLPPLPRH